MFWVGSDERSLHNIADLIDAAEYSLSFLKKGQLPPRYITQKMFFFVFLLHLVDRYIIFSREKARIRLYVIMYYVYCWYVPRKDFRHKIKDIMLVYMDGWMEG